MTDTVRRRAARVLAERPVRDTVEPEGVAILKQIAARLPSNTPANSPSTGPAFSIPVRNPFYDSFHQPPSSSSAAPKRAASIRSVDSQGSASTSAYGSTRGVGPSSVRVKEQVLDYLSDFYSADYGRQSSTILDLCRPHVIYQNPALFVKSTQDLIDVAKILPAVCKAVTFDVRSATIWTAKQTSTPYTVLVETTTTLHFKKLLVWRLFQFAFGNTYTYRASHVVSADAMGKIVHHEEVISLKDFLTALPILGRLYQIGRPCLAMLVGGRVGGIVLKCLDGDPRNATRRHIEPLTVRPASPPQPPHAIDDISAAAEPEEYIPGNSSPSLTASTVQVEERELVPLRPRSVTSPPHVEVLAKRGWFWF
ncbi:hypothetical protein HDU88_007603 [Geranomyces variabilis]|nr:hypothetical protein HDU88_007603 [Geranomyces variabilis]